jgi:peptidoglycan/LPS O-acetylase OafA/YrhL
MHVGVGHAFFMIGILLLASRKADIAVAKTILIAYLIGIAAMFVVMNMILGQSEVINFSIEMVVPDMVFFVLAIYGYFKAK